MDKKHIHWDIIKKMGDLIDECNDSTFIIKFIKCLADKKLLNRHFFSIICSATYTRADSNTMYELLHEFAEINEVEICTEFNKLPKIKSVQQKEN